MRLKQARIVALLSTIVACIVIACSPSPSTQTVSEVSSSAPAQKIGYIYVGPQTDMGYNYSMDLGRQYVESNVDNVETTYFDNIPETADVARVIERLIQDDHNIIFATSYGYLDYAIEVGKKHPDVSILHAGGLKTSDNVGTYWADSDDAMYLAGMVAGSMTKTNKLGFLGAFQIPQLLRTINAFTMGAQSVNPDITTTVVWTGAWLDPAKEAEATNSLIDSGADVIAGQVDSPLTYAQTAERRGVYAIGKDVNVQDRAPKAWLTGASWNWGPMMTELVEEINAGTWEAGHKRGTLENGDVVLDPFGAAVSEEIKALVLTAKESILSGEKTVWKGPLVKQDGTVVAPEGKAMDIQEIETMDYLVKGVVGSAS
ncbi:MAG: BMP family ABC transporter substrate-binding protein [Kaiparowitsia implicata GSE-PSE-MK54-09C]|jgi:basic membrane lipoprotein Med (substrate-binding protein (PBP1-ABC) superfamily)|nr:BMP family ABC transporter substrate-binding protein [Kaiparowitsia implicata GSE-PSE-MK54-09C]